MLVDNLLSFSFFDDLDIPVIAAITGVCLGSALELALFCHCRICGSGSVLGLPESSFGLMPGCGGIQKLRAFSGLPRAMELVLSGSSFTAEEAYRWNIVDAIVPRKDTITDAIRFIKLISPGYSRARMSRMIHTYL
jgi:enoyl-CoA hydratase/carnithine racemase